MNVNTKFREVELTEGETIQVSIITEEGRRVVLFLEANMSGIVVNNGIIGARVAIESPRMPQLNPRILFTDDQFVEDGRYVIKGNW